MTAHFFETSAPIAGLGTDAKKASPMQRAAGAASRHERPKAKSSIEFRLIFLAAFLIFFFAAAIERLWPLRSTDQAGHSAPPAIRKSIVAQAKESASIVAGYAFMG